MKRILPIILILSSFNAIAQTATKTSLQKFWKLTSMYEKKGKWTSKLEGYMKTTYMHFRDGSVLVETDDGDADKGSWRYDEATKMLHITYKGSDGDIPEDYKVVSVSETELELEAKYEDGNKGGMRFTAKPYPFFPRLPTSLSDLLFNLAIPYSEANTMLKQWEYEVEKTQTSGSLKTYHYKSGSLKLLLYASSNDVTGMVTDISKKDYRDLRAELKRKGYTESYDRAQRELTLKSNNYLVTFYNIYSTEEYGQMVDVMVGIYDLKEMSVN